eukprot:365800-Chlamydomonas_euryale.AAC.28
MAEGCELVSVDGRGERDRGLALTIGGHPHACTCGSYTTPCAMSAGQHAYFTLRCNTLTDHSTAKGWLAPSCRCLGQPYFDLISAA